MSTYEYNDLFLKCQDTAPYHVFTFDIKNSRKIMDGEVKIKSLKLISMIYKAIQKKEKEENKKILFFGEGYTTLEEVVRPNCFGYKQEPFMLGDLIGFTVYRDSISREEVLKIFNESKKTLEIDFEFHLADGYYETDDYAEGVNKYFRGYCIDLLSNLHKPYNDKVRRALQKMK